MTIEPGIYPGLSNEAYHGHLASYSKSSAADCAEYPYKMIYNRTHRERSQKFDLGTAAHSAILEPEAFEDTLALIPADILGKGGARSTKAYKEWLADQPADKAVVDDRQRDQVLRIRDSVLNNPAHSRARELLTGGVAEVSVFWHELFEGDYVDEETGYHFMSTYQHGIEGETTHKLLMKCRPDYLPGYNNIIVDLKTTKTALDEETIQRHCYNLKYHWSAALSCRGLTTAAEIKKAKGEYKGRTLHNQYVFVIVEIDPPHEVIVMNADRDFMALGIKQIMDVLQRLAWCDKNDRWPGIPNKIKQLSLPGWALRKLDAQD
jgi:hypothetical protein